MPTPTTDYYSALGVSENASPAEIKAAFRKLAKKFHPDRNKGSKSSETKFKEISEANDTLSDPAKRAEYDMIRKYGHAGPQFGGPGQQYERDTSADGRRSFRFNFDPRGGTTEQFESSGNLNDILEEILGHSGGRPAGVGSKRRSRRPQRGEDIGVVLPITFTEAALGATKILRGKSTGKTLTVKIPAGIGDGGELRLEGHGRPGGNGGESGDLLIRIYVLPDPYFTRQGNDVSTKLEIDFREAVLGCKKTVKSLHQAVSLNIPAGTQPGTKMRLKGQGIRARGVIGDQYVEIAVRIPTRLTEKQKKLMEEWEG
jgi:DnaJ-class molecular chaperone